MPECLCPGTPDFGEGLTSVGKLTLRLSQQSVTFLNRVPVHLTVTDPCKYSRVTLPIWGLGIGFSYSQHSKTYQLLNLSGWFLLLKLTDKLSRFLLRSSALHVKLIDGSHVSGNWMARLQDDLYAFVCLPSTVWERQEQQKALFVRRTDHLIRSAGLIAS